MKDIFEKELNSLNEQQKEAVTHQGGPLFVVAGAGTGKTKTLTTRIAYLIKELHVDKNAILAVTFTNKAAREIRNRVDRFAFPEEMGDWLYTFHAFGLRILRAHAVNLNMGYKNDFMVIDEDDAATIIRDLLKRYNYDSKKYPPRSMKNFISNHKTKINEIIDPNILDIYNKYQSELVKEQLMDFDDLIVYTHNLFKNNKVIREIYQNQFEHILVDEFQDTDLMQYEIIKLLNCKNTVVVGDPDQSIYAFRGARYENNSLFVKDFKAKIIVLDKNYRSTNNILTAANLLIKNNMDREAKKELKSDYGDGIQVQLYQANDDYEEVNSITSEIMRLTQTGYRYDDIAVLYRTNSLSRSFEHSFTQNQIPYIIYGGTSFYERKEVKDFLAYLKVIVDNDSNFYFKRIVNVPARGLGNVTIQKLEDYSILNNISMFEAIDSVTLPAKALSGLKEFKQLIIKLRKEILEKTELIDVIDVIYFETKYHELLKEEIDEKAKERKENINELKSVLKMASDELEGNNLEKIKAVLDEIALYTSHDKKPSNDNSLKLATVHQVKGLEFKVVFIVAMEEGIFPNERSYNSRSEIEEDRRVFYVAITRAKERLYITHAAKRLLYGKIGYPKGSMFLREIRNIENPGRTKTDTYKKQEKNNLVLNAGDIVNHDIFGKGVVVEIRENIATIAFSHEHGIKKLIKDHPSIKK